MKLDKIFKNCVNFFYYFLIGVYKYQLTFSNLIEKKKKKKEKKNRWMIHMYINEVKSFKDLAIDVCPLNIYIEIDSGAWLV